METNYKGRIMRSQLEARWAAMFDLLGWEYDYEPSLDLNGWIPDFILYAGDYTEDELVKRHEILVEVKPFSSKGDFKKILPKIDGAIKGTRWEHTEILLLGSGVFSPIEDELLTEFAILGWYYSQFEKVDWVDGVRHHSMEKGLFEAFLIQLDVDRAVKYDLTDGEWFSRFNGYWCHNYGASYSLAFAFRAYLDDAKKLWNEAGNTIRWTKGIKQNG